MATQIHGAVSGAARRAGWRDWAIVILSIWLFMSPWIVRYGTSPQAGTGGPGTPGAAIGGAAWNAWVVATIIFVVGVSAISRMDFRQERVALALGIWLFIAPWVLGFSGLPYAAWDHWIVGALVFLIALSMLGRAPRLTENQDGRRGSV